MKYLISFLLFWNLCFGLGIEEAIDLSIQNSDKIKSQTHLYSRSQKLAQAKFSTLMPKLDFSYIMSYNMPGEAKNYLLNSANITARYNLFNGMKDYYGIKNARQENQTQNYTLQSDMADVALQTKLAYISILQASDTYKIAEQSKELLNAQRKKAQQFYNQGFRAKNEVLSVEVLLANANITLKSAQLNLEYYKNTLETLTNSPIDIKDLQDIATNAPKKFDRDKIIQKILSENPDYLRLQSLLQSALIDTQIAKGNFMPSVDIVASKFWYIDGGGVARTNYALQSQARMLVSWNIFNGLSDHYNYQAKKLYYLSLMSQINQYKKDLKIQVDKLLNDYELANEQFKVASVALKQAEENYRIINNRYAQNIATYTELLDAQFLLTTAKTNITQSKYEIAISASKVDRLLNTNSIHSIKKN